MSDYVLSGQSWASQTVTWYFTGSAGFASQVAQAFNRWDDVVELDFTQAASTASADIALDFGFIDGAYNTLGVAHSVWSVPSNNYTGDTTIEFDSAENWNWSASAGSYVLSSGVTFLSVALHEIGHAIGLNHPTNGSALMYAIASAGVTDLTTFDIEGARLIYGVETDVIGPIFTAGDDSVGLTNGGTCYALAGHDSVAGSLGNDHIYGGAGRHPCGQCRYGPSIRRQRQ